MGKIDFLGFVKAFLNKTLTSQKPGILALAISEIGKLPTTVSLVSYKASIASAFASAVASNTRNLSGYQQFLIAGVAYQFGAYLNASVSDSFSTVEYRDKAIVVLTQFIERLKI